MENKQTKTIKTVSVIVIVFSAFIVFSNVIGALIYSLLGSSNKNPNITLTAQIADGFNFLWAHYLQLCFSMSLIGICNLVGGIGLLKLKNWGRLIIIASSTLISFSIMFFPIFIIIANKKNPFLGLPGILTVVIAFIILWIPFVLLIRYLTRGEIRNHFA